MQNLKMKLSRLDDLTESHSMDNKAGSHMIEKIMHLTLDILYLLTGEDYIVLKMSGGRITHSSSPVVCGGFGRTQSPVVESTPHSLMHENDQRILELTNKIIQLLTGEVPIRCEDITVYFSMEEWEYIKGNKDPHKDVVNENHQPLTSQDECNEEKPPEKCPSAVSAQNSTDDHNIPQNDQNEILNTTLVSHTMVVDVEETYEMGDQKCEMEEMPAHIGTDGSSKRNTPERCPSPLRSQDGTEEDQSITRDYQSENLANLTIEVESSGDEDETDEMEEEMSDYDEPQCREDEIPTDRSTGRMSEQSLNVAVIVEIDEPCDKTTQQPEVKQEEDPCDDTTGGSTVKPLHTPVMLQQSAEWEIHEDGSTHPLPPGGQLEHKRKYVLASSKPDSKNVQGSTNTFSCSECGKCFTGASHLEAHQKVHNGEAPFSCSECGKSFSSSSNLGLHLKIHRGEQLFACSDCGKCFTVKANLLAHQIIHTGEKPFACAECGRRFALKSSLDTHLAVHTLEKPFVCPACGKCFTTNARLALHQNTHIGEKSYECEDCGKVFTTSGSLNRHKRTHTGEKPYACMVCGKCFNRETNLYRHQMIHTR
ncbi:uncharacterized protein LOC142159845 [Mixophyes fleayi]|uniref:uncharacterized protein LOC142159845 n=1 Tax=Mixophyes fleayi TaxID=3061075 RepID=UPI003F4DE901